MRIAIHFAPCKRLLLGSLLLAASALWPVVAQELNKLSVTTQMFLDEQEGRISLDVPAAIAKQPSVGQKNDFVIDWKHERFIASPVQKAGKSYVSAFVRVTDRSAVSDLEALGVEIECEFSNGTLYTALIPVDKIRAVAKLSRVTHINVAKKCRPLTNAARQGSNVDDVLTYSASARAAGLPNAYDGTGVLLGVIDSGIDYQHKAFKDKNGNSRIKRAYVVTTSGYSHSANEYGDGTSNAITTSQPTTDDNQEDHGTHTSSTAGGSSVVLNGTSTTVTDDHANATYGGMAPGADLYLAGCDLSETYLANSFQKICNYADSKGMPVVVSNSWGGQYGPHDGTGDIAEVVNQYFGDSHPNHICLFAASNDAGTNGFHVSGTSTKSNPLGTVMNYNTDYGLSYYYGILANAWSRSTGVTLMCKVIVLKSNGTKVTEIEVNPSSQGSQVSGLSSYASGSLVAYRNYVSSSKSQILLYTSGLQLYSGYKLAVQFYPSNGSTLVDIWSGAAYTYFTNTPSTSGYTWTKGSDDMCVSDEATIANAISIGAYSTKTSVTDYQNHTHQLNYTLGDVAYFSSYAVADQSPTGESYPWICAPGATVISAVNHYDTNGDVSFLNGNSEEYGYYRVNSDTSNPYGSLEGTSMATPAAAGVVALWLQAAKSVGKELTVNDVKEIMRATAITDSYTNGTNRTHFGNGKIDALAGIQYILGDVVETPRINAEPASLDFGEIAAGSTVTKTFTVTGANLEGDITLTVSDTEHFTVSSTHVAMATAEAGGSTITVTFKPTARVAATYSGTITLTSSNATNVEVALTGKATYVGPAIVAPTQMAFDPVTVGGNATQTFNLSGTNLEGNVMLTLTDAAGVFQLSNTTVSKADATAGKTVTITFTPKANEAYTATVKLASNNAQTVTMTLTGTGAFEVPVMRPADEEYVKHTSFRADWDDATAAENIASYTLEVSYVEPTPPQPEYVLLDEADLSGLTAVTGSGGGLTNQSSNASNYLPEGWSVNNYLYVNNGSIIIREQNNASSNLRTSVTLPEGFDKISVVVDCEAFQANSTNIETGLTVKTVSAGDTQTQMLTNDMATYTYVLNAQSNEQIQFNPYTTSTRYWAYVSIASIKIYAGDISEPSNARLLAAVETGDSTTRVITGITGKSYVVRDLTAGGTFTYKVKAVYANQSESEWSNVEEVTLSPTPDVVFLPGDVNADGSVDINDVNILINIVLDLDNAANYDGRAYILGNSTVDVADVNALINMVLN